MHAPYHTIHLAFSSERPELVGVICSQIFSHPLEISTMTPSCYISVIKSDYPDIYQYFCLQTIVIMNVRVKSFYCGQQRSKSLADSSQKDFVLVVSFYSLFTFLPSSAAHLLLFSWFIGDNTPYFTVEFIVDGKTRLDSCRCSSLPLRVFTRWKLHKFQGGYYLAWTCPNCRGLCTGIYFPTRDKDVFGSKSIRSYRWAIAHCVLSRARLFVAIALYIPLSRTFL